MLYVAALGGGECGIGYGIHGRLLWNGGFEGLR